MHREPDSGRRWPVPRAGAAQPWSAFRPACGACRPPDPRMPHLWLKPRVPPSASLRIGSPAFVISRHDAHQDHWRARIDTHSWLLRQLFRPARMYPRSARAPSPVYGVGPARTAVLRAAIARELPLTLGDHHVRAAQEREHLGPPARALTRKEPDLGRWPRSVTRRCEQQRRGHHPRCDHGGPDTSSHC